MSQLNWPEVQHLYYWPENERLKTALQEGKFDIIYTMPGLKSDEMLVDKMAQTVLQMTGNKVTRPVINQNVEGLKQLINSGNLRAAYNLTNTLLTQSGQGLGKAGHPTKNSFEIFEIWSCRFQLMLALKLFNQLEAELSSFDDLEAPDTFFQYYPDLKQKGYYGSIIPFSMRLIYAEAPRYSTDPVQAIKRCCDLEANTRQVIDRLHQERRAESQMSLWQARLEAVLMTKARAWCTIKEYSQAISIYNDLLEAASEEKKPAILQLLSRLAILIGDEKLVERYTRELTIQNIGTQNFYLHKGFKAAFFGNFSKALEHLQTAQKGTGGLSNPAVTNNEAICQLYSGKVDDARHHLLSFNGVPTEPIFQNINTVSQLVGTAKDNSKQQFFLKNVENMGDVFDPQNLKITN